MISRDNGVLYGNSNILGYNREEGTYQINEELADTVRLIFDLYLNGFGTKKIMNELCRLKRKDAYGDVKWSLSKINRILRNSTYKGTMAYDKSRGNNFLEQKRINNHDDKSYTYMQADFPPIIDEDDWYKAQEIRKSKVLKVNIDGKEITKEKKLRMCG